MKGLDLAEGFEDSGVSWVETFSGDCFRGGLLGVANISSARFQVRETRFVAVMRYIPISWAISFPHPLPHPCAQRDEMYEADVRGGTLSALGARIARNVFDIAETPEAGAAVVGSGSGRFGEDANQFAQVKVATGQYSHNPLAC